MEGIAINLEGQVLPAMDRMGAAVLGPVSNHRTEKAKWAVGKDMETLRTPC